jgi:hypothetical protein
MPSEELMTILRHRDASEWPAEVFEISRTLLLERGFDIDAWQAIGSRKRLELALLIWGPAVVALLLLLLECVLDAH